MAMTRDGTRANANRDHCTNAVSSTTKSYIAIRTNQSTSKVMTPTGSRSPTPTDPTLTILLQRQPLLQHQWTQLLYADSSNIDCIHCPKKDGSILDSSKPTDLTLTEQNCSIADSSKTDVTIAPTSMTRTVPTPSDPKIPYSNTTTTLYYNTDSSKTDMSRR